MDITISHPVGRWQIDQIAFIPQPEQAAPAPAVAPAPSLAPTVAPESTAAPSPGG
jgi:hypothetical protein